MATKGIYEDALNGTNPIQNTVAGPTETLDPQIPRNTMQYSPQNKADLARSYGLDPATVPQDAYFRQSTPSGAVLAMKDQYRNAMATPTDEAGLQGRVADIGTQYAQAVSGFRKSDVIDRIRAKTGGVSDLDKQIADLQYKQLTLRPQLLQKYASVIDPVQKEALISQELQNVQSEMNYATALREKRLGTTSQLIEAEISDNEQKMNALAKQYDIVRNQLGDLRESEKIKREIERTNLENEKLKADTAALNIKIKSTEQDSGTPVWGGDSYGTPPTPTQGELADYTNSLRRTGNNVGQDTNNPSNIMAENPKQVENAKRLGAIGTYKSPKGRTYAVFPTMEAGMNAARQEIETKLSGGSYWVTPSTTLGQLASGWTVGPKAPYNKQAAQNYALFAGYPESTPIFAIPKDDLIRAIIRNEGVNPNVSAPIKQIGQPVRAQAQPQSQGQAPLPYDDYVFTAMGSVPTQMKNSDKEQAFIRDFAKKLYERGVSPELASAQMTGVNISGLTNEDGKKIMEYANKLDTFGVKVDEQKMRNIAAQVKKKDTGTLEKELRSAADLNVQKVMHNAYIPTAGIEAAADEINKLNALITKNWDKIGIVSGPISNFKQAFRTDAEYQQFKTALQKYQSEARRAFGGTAVTESELTALKDFIGGNESMDAGNLREMVNTVFKSNRNAYNVQQRTYGIPNPRMDKESTKTDKNVQSYLQEQGLGAGNATDGTPESEYLKSLGL